MIFCLYYYIIILLEFVWQSSLYIIYIDIEYTITLINCKFLENLVLNLSIKKTQAFISICDIDIARYLIDNYLILDIYIKDYIRNKESIAHICRKIYIVDNFKIKLLLNINIIAFEQIIVNLDIKQFTLNSYRELTTSLNITTQNNIKICRVLKLKYRIVVDTNSIVVISV